MIRLIISKAINNHIKYKPKKLKNLLMPYEGQALKNNIQDSKKKK